MRCGIQIPSDDRSHTLRQIPIHDFKSQRMSGGSHQPSMLQDNRVAVIQERPRYTRTPPFAPSEAFPEWPGGPVGEEDNPAYRAVRAALAALDLDASHAGTPAWNPL